MKRPWTNNASTKPWNETPPKYGKTRHNTREYNTTRWQKARKAFLLHHPLCIECDKIGLVTMATVVDHIIPVREGVDFWDQSNWQPLCTKHHRIKTNSEINKRR